jgi:hypothetical protein
MVTVVTQHAGWQVALAVLPVMLGMYRSFQKYFVPLMEANPAPIGQLLARSAAAAH